MKGLALTFDDGRISHFYFARPLLKSIGAKGTFYICHASFDEPKMDVEHLRILESEGFELGNHTFSHINLKKNPI